MPAPATADLSLTGLWRGRFWYPEAFDPVSFTATLVDVEGRFSGSTVETESLDASPARTLHARLEGVRSRRLVVFAKNYDAAANVEHTIGYTGELSEDGAEISGTWAVTDEWTGAFLMIRAPGQAAATWRKTAARA